MLPHNIRKFQVSEKHIRNSFTYNLFSCFYLTQIKHYLKNLIQETSIECINLNGEIRYGIYCKTDVTNMGYCVRWTFDHEKIYNKYIEVDIEYFNCILLSIKEINSWINQMARYKYEYGI